MQSFVKRMSVITIHVRMEFGL